MKKSAITLSFIAAVILFPLAQADDRHHPEKVGVAVADSAPSTSTGRGMMMDMDRMQEMHKMMEKAQQTTDPAERQRLMDEHMEQMHKMMGDMHGMMGKGMTNGAPGDERQQMMEKRMDMMQGMMEQMMEHMMAGQGAKQPGGNE